MNSQTIQFRIIAIVATLSILSISGLFLILREANQLTSPDDPRSHNAVSSSQKTDNDRATENTIALVDVETNIRRIAATTTIIISMVGILGAIWIINYFKRSLRIPQIILNELVQGNTNIEIPAVQNEFSPIVTSISQLSGNIQRSSQFAENIGEGNFAYDFTPAGNHDTLGNALLQMREKLKNISDTDKIQNWTTTGLAMFADLIRKGGDQKTLSDTLIGHLVKYTHSTQGGLYTLLQDEGQDSVLELSSCYAYERKKYTQKRIDIGTGLLGQCFLEGSSINLRQVPDNYVTITSGLGMSNPTSILLVPLKLNESVEGVVELASFSHYQQHEIEFVERVGEMMASAIATVRVTDKTKRMLEESQQQSEEMRAQEEEMRQNMEEMQATQEAMERQTIELKRMQQSLEVEKSMFAALMDALPDRITYKDTQSRITRINKAKAQRLNMHADDVIGKTDYDFFAAEHAEKAMREEKALLDSGRPLLDIEELLTFNNGETAWVSSSRIPFRNEHHVMTGMFIISKDITKLKRAEIQLAERNDILKNLFNEFPIIQFSIDKDDRITPVAIGRVPDPQILVSSLKGKIIQDVLPNIGKTLRAEIAQAAPVLDTLPNGWQLKQFVFQDKVHTDAYTIVAIVIS